MTDQYIDLNSLKFNLFHVHALPGLLEYDRYSTYDPEAIDQFLDAVKDFSDKELFPYFRDMDKQPAHYRDDTIQVHPQVPAYMRKSGEMGFIASPFPEKDGGLQLPQMVVSASMFIQESANNHLPGYAGLTMGAAELLLAFAEPSLREKFLPKMLAGEWSGTMCLTEPQAGSSLSDIVTLAEPKGPYYLITGQKIFISGGDYAGIENVVHLLLARIQGAPPGTRGISLFAVPKFRMDEHGDKEFNDVNTLGDFQKLGQKGYCTAHLSFGDHGDCRGWLVGKPHHGLEYMFRMMNSARIAVGRGAAAISSAAYLASLAFARERPQGRKLSGSGKKDPDQEQTLIIHHPDVKRMLMLQKVISEGSLSLVLQTAKYSDLSKSHPDPKERERYFNLLEFLTPIAKTYPSEKGIVSVNNGLQVLGGYGYCEDFILQQYFRDIRIFPIYEGTTGIQSLDLLGRKATMHNGAAFSLLTDEIRQCTDRNSEHGTLGAFAETLREQVDTAVRLHQFLLNIAAKGEYERFLSDATLFMELMGTLVVGWQWLEIASRAQQLFEDSRNGYTEEFLQAKIEAMSFFFKYELPGIEALAGTMMNRDAITTREESQLFGDNP